MLAFERGQGHRGKIEYQDVLEALSYGEKAEDIFLSMTKKLEKVRTTAIKEFYC